MTKKQFSVLTLLGIIIMALLILLSRRLWFRLDLTSGKAFTLSPVSRKLHNEIEENVRITYFLSDKLMSLDPTAGEISDILREYEARSRGKIQVAIKDPGKNPSEAERFNLTPQQLQNVGQDEASFSVVYSGIVIEYLNNYEVLQWVFSLDTLEYDITSRIRSLISGKHRELGIIAAEGQKTWNEYYGFLNQTFLASGYSVLQLRPGEEIPDTLPVLFVMGGAEELDEYSLYRIDRYIQLGGRVFFAIESVEVDFFNTWEGRIKNDKGLLAMVSYYGITQEQGLVLDRSSIPIPFRDPVTQQLKPIRYPPWIGVKGNQGNPNHPLTSKFTGADLFWACPLLFTLPESGNVRGDILFTSSPESWLMVDNFILRPEMMPSTNGAGETMGEKILAASLEGVFPSWFQNMEKPRRTNYQSMDPMYDLFEESEDDLPSMPLEPKESRIIVVGDSDMGGPLIQYSLVQQGANLNFLLQAADWLGMDDDIVGIRNRQGGMGRLDRITDEAKRFGMISFSRILNIFIVPLCICLFGILRIIKRRHKKEHNNAL